MAIATCNNSNDFLPSLLPYIPLRLVILPTLVATYLDSRGSVKADACITITHLRQVHKSIVIEVFTLACGCSSCKSFFSQQLAIFKEAKLARMKGVDMTCQHHKEDLH
ncbi:uncharacterized protein LOC109787724 isoform X1 [Cajanus cajan]|uniref:uncharacterized protein LOC109787724 isoform X1 n=1 Tax=Cajanus cajan TaxID=3821 RepID=UPI00098DC1BE|nr:uncharacterized protein LOC109787724 isoform X1 [Cajanus cajan]